MTAIVATKNKNRILIGADSLSCTESLRLPIECDSAYKVRKINGSSNSLIACTGSCSVIYVIDSIPNLLDGKVDVCFDYMVRNVIPKIIDALEKNDQISEDEDGKFMKCSLLIATKFHLYQITNTFTLSEIDHIAFAGSAEHALYAKYNAIKDKVKDPKELIIECLKHAIEYGPNIDYPIVIGENTEDVSFDIINRN